MNQCQMMGRELLVGNKNGGGRLPAGYQEVEWIASNGLEYIEITNILSSTLTTELSFSLLPSFAMSNVAFLFGGYMQSVSCYSCAVQSANYFRVPNGGDMFINIRANNINIGNHIISYTFNNVLFDEQRIATAKGLSGSYKTLRLFGRCSNNPADEFITANFKCYYFKFKNNSEVLNELIPCYQKSDGETGLFDIVTNTFYGNQGTGAFTKGADVN